MALCKETFPLNMLMYIVEKKKTYPKSINKNTKNIPLV